MARSRWLLGALILLAGPALADEAAERRQLAAELRAVDARFERERSECAQRFALNACIDEARKRHRQTQSVLKARQRELDEQQRAQRAIERRTAIDRRQQLQPSQPSQPSRPTLQAGASQPAAAPSAAAASRRDPRERRAAEAAAARAKAAERAAAARKLQASIQADQERIKARQAQREAKGKKVPPLPPPPGALGSAPGA